MTRKCGDWLRTYLQYTSLSESPELFHFWAGVSTIAGTLRRRVWFNMGHFEWTPNFYIIFVAPAGVAAKSTTIRIGTDLLREIENVHLGPDSGTWQALGKCLMEAEEMVPMPTGSNNIGPDGLVDPLTIEYETMSCITCSPGELGTFLNFQDPKLISTLTALWDGQRETFEHLTATQTPIRIVNPWINIISATTPSWLKMNMPEAAIGDGFASRVVFVFANRKRHLVPYPGLSSTPGAHKTMRTNLIHDLQEISELVGEMRLTPDAITWGTEWYQTHWAERPVHMASERFDGYRARKQTHIHKLAMVLAASRGTGMWIEVEELMKAATITTAMEQDMVNVFESIGVAPTSRLINELLSFIKTYQDRSVPVTKQLLWRFAMQIMSAQEFSESINSAVLAGYLQLTNTTEGDVYKLLVDPTTIRRTDADAASTVAAAEKAKASLAGLAKG